MTATLNSELPTTAAQQNQTYAPAYPHGKSNNCSGIFSGCRASIRVGPREHEPHMVIIRNRHELTLINPVRLNETGKSANWCYRVTHVFRLLAIFMAWMISTTSINIRRVSGASLPEHSASTACECASENRPDMPLPHAELFIFDNAQYPEAALLLTKHKMSAHHRLAAIPE